MVSTAALAVASGRTLRINFDPVGARMAQVLEPTQLPQPSANEQKSAINGKRTTIPDTFGSKTIWKGIETSFKNIQESRLGLCL